MCHINQLYSESEEKEEEDESTDPIHCGTRGVIPSLCLYAASISLTCLQHFSQSSWITAAIADLVSFKMALTQFDCKFVILFGYLTLNLAF